MQRTRRAISVKWVTCGMLAAPLTDVDEALGAMLATEVGLLAGVCVPSSVARKLTIPGPHASVSCDATGCDMSRDHNDMRSSRFSTSACQPW
jgi:hypothetical protein